MELIKTERKMRKVQRWSKQEDGHN